MKKIKLLFPLFTLLALFGGCKSEDYSGMNAPRILYMVDKLTVDLNAANQPSIVSVVQSEAGLVKVSEYIIKTGGAELLYQEPVMTFPNNKSYSINQLPLYLEDMIAYRIVALDKAGKETVAELPLQIIPLRDTPLVKFFVANIETTEFTWEEGTPHPSIRIEASSLEELRTLVFSEVINRTEKIIKFNGVDTLKFNDNEMAYTFKAEDVGYGDIHIQTKSLKIYVAAGDPNRLKRKIATLKVNVIEKPAPIITFTGGASGIVTEFQNKEISGNITSVSLLKTVSFYRKKKTGKVLLETKTFSPEVTSHAFSYSITTADMQDEGLEVVATDRLDKTQETSYALTVIETAPAPTIALTQNAEFFNGLDAGASTLTGTITSGAGLTSINIITKSFDGMIIATIPVTVTSGDLSKTLNEAITFGNAVRKVSIEATDINTKKTTLTHDVYVGYYFARVLMSLDGSGGKTNTTGSLPGPFFAAKYRKAMSYQEGKADPTAPDLCFGSWSSNAAIRVGNMQFPFNANSSNKFTGHAGINAGVDTWTVPLSAVPFGPSQIAKAEFNKATIDDILLEPTPTGISGANYVLFASGASFPEITDQLVVIYMATINGNQKRVLVSFDSVGTNNTTIPSFSTFYIKVKIQK